MKGVEYILIVAGILLVWYLSSRSQETFVPEFLDQSNVKRTAETSTSSYAQQTNHTLRTPVDMGPVPGMETPFRVNMYNSHMV